MLRLSGKCLGADRQIDVVDRFGRSSVGNPFAIGFIHSGETVVGAHVNLPMVRIKDAAVYMRPCQGGVLWGVYEEAPRFFDMQSLGPNFDIKDMPLDIEVLRSAAVEVKDQLPILKTAQIREFRGGIPTMTADGHHILGPAPRVEGFYFVACLDQGPIEFR